jgi:hypothetical protein
VTAREWRSRQDSNLCFLTADERELFQELTRATDARHLLLSDVPLAAKVMLPTNWSARWCLR